MAVFQIGLAVLVAGLVALARPIALVGLTSRWHGAVLAGLGLLALGAGALWPARERRVARVLTRLDEYAPAWQFSEHHSLWIDAPPERAYEAVRTVRAGEIRFFGLLTWLRRGGRSMPEGILQAPRDAPILDAALRGGFLLLADDPPREVVVGMIVIGTTGSLSGDPRDAYRALAAPGFAKATMNFLVEGDGKGGSVVTTETRVFGTDAAARRRFAIYWRVIQPGSAFIRRMWLRAIRDRAQRPSGGQSRTQRALD